MQINRIAVCFLFLVVMISSCRHESENADKTIFRLNLATPLTSLDPAFASDQSNTWSVNQLFSGLVQLDSALNVNHVLPKVGK
jgi:MarR-like DNA-binding transcriptional regulator SgrR of sgrS sRNA